MKKIIYCILLLTVLITCKKKTTASVRVFNPMLNENVPNAVVSLMEIKEPGFQAGIRNNFYDCTEIATATTDANGIAFFDEVKLKKRKTKYKYKFGVKTSWNIDHDNPCGSPVRYIQIGESQDVVLSDFLYTKYKVQFTSDLLEPSINGDFIHCDILTCAYYDFDTDTQKPEGIISNTFNLSHNDDYPVYPHFSEDIDVFATRLVVKTHKRKMGIETNSIDTVRAYPTNNVTIVKLIW